MLLERDVKKYDLQMKQMEDTAKRDTYRIYGELLNTYGYDAKPGARALEALNYYTNEMITIPLDTRLTAAENAKKYLRRIEEFTGVPVKFIGTGAGREDMIVR